MSQAIPEMSTLSKMSVQFGDKMQGMSQAAISDMSAQFGKSLQGITNGMPTITGPQLPELEWKLPEDRPRPVSLASSASRPAAPASISEGRNDFWT